MAPYPSQHLRHRCQQDGCYLDEHLSWDFLAGVFPRGIVPMDVDGLVEIGGHFLFLEGKRAGASAPDGQARALHRLANLPHVNVWAFRPCAGGLEVKSFHGHQTWKLIDTSLFRRQLSAWAHIADQHPVWEVMR